MSLKKRLNVDIPFSIQQVIKASSILPLCGLFFCIIWSYVFDFEVSLIHFFLFSVTIKLQKSNFHKLFCWIIIFRKQLILIVMWLILHHRSRLQLEHLNLKNRSGKFVFIWFVFHDYFVTTYICAYLQKNWYNQGVTYMTWYQHKIW